MTEPLHVRVTTRAAQLRRNASLAAKKGCEPREYSWMVDTATLLDDVAVELAALREALNDLLDRTTAEGMVGE